MCRPDLVVGLTHVLRTINDQTGTTDIECVYEGQHDGVLSLADGSTYHGGHGALRFRVTDGGSARILQMTRAL